MAGKGHVRHLDVELVTGMSSGKTDIHIYKKGKTNTGYDELEEEAYKILVNLFKDYHVKLFRPYNSIDCGDTPVQYRGSINLYVRRNIPALIATLNVCKVLGIDVNILHFNKDIGAYISQKAL